MACLGKKPHVWLFWCGVICSVWHRREVHKAMARVCRTCDYSLSPLPDPRERAEVHHPFSRPHALLKWWKWIDLYRLHLQEVELLHLVKNCILGWGCFTVVTSGTWRPPYLTCLLKHAWELKIGYEHTQWEVARLQIDVVLVQDDLAQEE